MAAPCTKGRSGSVDGPRSPLRAFRLIPLVLGIVEVASLVGVGPSGQSRRRWGHPTERS